MDKLDAVMDAVASALRGGPPGTEDGEVWVSFVDDEVNKERHARRLYVDITGPGWCEGFTIEIQKFDE